MKRKLFLLLALIIGSLGAWAQSTDFPSNSKVYTIKGYTNNALNVYYDGTNDYVRISTTAGETDNYKWVIYTLNDKTYLYNVGAGKLVLEAAGTGGHYNWRLVDNCAIAINISKNGEYYILRSEHCLGAQDYLHYNSKYTYGSTNWGTGADNSKWTFAEAGDASEELQAQVAAIIEANIVTIPATSKYYFLKGVVSGNYLKADGTTLSMKEGKSNATLFYLADNYALKAFDTGNYINAYDKNLSTTEYSGAITIGAYGNSNGRSYFYKNNNYYMYDKTTATDRGTDNNHERYQWLFEEYQTPRAVWKEGDNSNDHAGIKSFAFTVPTTDVLGNDILFAPLKTVDLFVKTGTDASTSYMVISTSTNISDKVAVSTNAPTPANAFATYEFSDAILVAGKKYYVLFATDAAGTEQTNQRCAVSSTSATGKDVIDSKGSAHTDWAFYYKFNSSDDFTVEDMFSENYGDKWLRLTNCSNSSYAWYATADKLGTAQKNAANENQLFCFVGSPTGGFKIYSYELGSGKALTAANSNNGTPATWANAAEAKTWYLDSKYATGVSQAGYGITTLAPTEADRKSLNMYAGPGGDVNFYSNGSDNGGSRWTIQNMDVLTIQNSVPGAEGTYIWNGQTKTGNKVVFTSEGYTTNDEVTVSAVPGYTSNLSATTWNGVGSKTIINNLTPNFFTTEADITAMNENVKWVRINNVRYGNYYIYANDEEALHSHQPSATANELFALVGNENSFKLYSKTKQAYYGAANNNSGTAVVAGGANDTYKLVAKTGDYAGYAIVPTGNEGQSFNMHGGAGHDIKYYSAGDGGATWNVVEVVATTTMTINIEGETSPLNQLVGSFSYTADGVVSDVNVTYESLGKETVIYLPKAKSLVINESSLKTYKGYELKSAEFTNNSIAITYTATDARWLFQTYGKGRPYRIPSIAKAKNNDLIAISDDRFCGNDIGYGKVNIVYKVSHDNGKTWSEETMLAEGDGNNNSRTCGFGDAASVADRTSDKVMVMCVSAPNGGTCFKSAQRSSILWGEPNSDGTWKWTTPIDIKDEIMALLPNDRVNYFVGSGKLHQSRYIKVGDYYRVYAALWTSDGSDLKNYVVYSDNFGAAGSWKLLGTADVCPGPNGNEPKCEELPNGDVLLSARQPYHRLHNIFHYTNAETGEGSWGTSATGINNNDGPNGTDGEILIIEAKNKETGNKEWIGLQSAPNNGRANVSMWYKVLGSANDNTKYSTPAEFGKGWTLSKQFADYSSCYTTMCVQADKRIAFFYEDGQSGAGYDMVYMPLTLESVTENKYEFIGTEKDTEESTPETTVVIGDITSADEVAEVVDATASSVDMTQATVDAEISDEFVETIVAKTGNENTLVYVPASANVSAAKNVIVKDGSKYTCQSLVLTDKMPFSAPNEFTASNAVYTRTMANKWGTICLPYAVTSNENVAYYIIDRIEDGKLIINQVEGLEAGQPGLVQKFAGDGIAPAATSVEVVGSKDDQTLVDGTVTMIGSFANDTKVTDENAFYIKDNKFWQRAEASEQIADPCFYIDAFRAYFKVEPAANQSRIMSIVVNGDEATGIDALEIAEALSGKEGKFLQNGRVVIVKDNRLYTTAGQRLK